MTRSKQRKDLYVKAILRIVKNYILNGNSLMRRQHSGFSINLPKTIKIASLNSIKNSIWFS